MGDDVPIRPAESEAIERDRLDSWKEIAAYLKRDVTTVRRWEKREGLPIHRHLHDRRDSVYAFKRELDAWLDGRGNHVSGRLSDEHLSSHGEAIMPSVPTDTRSNGSPQKRSMVTWILLALLLICAGSLLVIYFRSQSFEQRALRLSVVPPHPSGDLALSPDGRKLAFVAGNDENARLWVRALDSTEPHELIGTEGAEAPFWSPDSRFIAFGAGGKLRKIAAAGGPVQTLCDARTVIGGTWNADDVLIFAPDNRVPLYRVPATGGEPTAITTLDSSRGHNTHRWPHFLPGDRRFLYLARSSRPEESGIYVGTLDSTAVTRVMAGESKVEYTQPGHLLFVRDRALLAQSFDVRTLRVAGDIVRMVDAVRYSREDGYATFSVSEHGEVAYQTNVAERRTELAWFDRSGTKIIQPLNDLHDTEEPSLSADGTRIAVTRSSGSSRDIWIVDAARGNSRVTSEPSADLMPVWSPDDRAIVFASNRDGPADLYRVVASGGSPAELLVKSISVKHPTDWSIDGRFIAYEVNDPKTSWDLWVLPVQPVAAPVPFLRTEFAEGHGRFSPDGQWIAYVSNESGTNEVYIRPFPASSGKWKISIGGGRTPRWRRDSKELFYIAPDQKLMSVAVNPRSTFFADTPKGLFETQASHKGEWDYDVTPDGQRFVISVRVGEASPAPIVIVLNWAGGLPQ